MWGLCSCEAVCANENVKEHVVRHCMSSYLCAARVVGVCVCWVYHIQHNVAYVATGPEVWLYEGVHSCMVSASY